jgi:hypothetical protein
MPRKNNPGCPCCGGPAPCPIVCGSCKLPAVDLLVSWYDDSGNLLGSITAYWLGYGDWQSHVCNIDGVSFFLRCNNGTLTLNTSLYTGGCTTYTGIAYSLTPQSLVCGNLVATYSTLSSPRLVALGYAKIVVTVADHPTQPKCCWWCSGQTPDLSVTALGLTWRVPYVGGCQWYGETLYQWGGNIAEGGNCPSSTITVVAFIYVIPTGGGWVLLIGGIAPPGFGVGDNDCLATGHLTIPPVLDGRLILFNPPQGTGPLMCQGPRPYSQNFGLQNLYIQGSVINGPIIVSEI